LTNPFLANKKNVTDFDTDIGVFNNIWFDKNNSNKSTKKTKGKVFYNQNKKDDLNITENKAKSYNNNKIKDCNLSKEN
jgi:hypothetical protein